MLYPTYTFKELEPQILDYWNKQKILPKKRKQNKDGPKFYFLEGPPYTSGHIHLGHAWNMALKDMVLRYKRMNGFNVWDRMGYDMHGLPTEQKVMAKLNLKDKQDIQEFGLKKFQKECKNFCLEMMEKMNDDFIRLGSTLDFSNPYQPIKKEYMQAEWWLIKKAHEKGRLYQGLRTMHWDAATQSSVAKHELEYKTITDTSIYMKFQHKTRTNTFFLIWTTTPWTIPLNLAIMANPDLTYVEVQAGKEIWILAKELVPAVMQKAALLDYKILHEYRGAQLEGQSYIHPLHVEHYFPSELQKNPKLFTILLSTEYVTATDGTGLVHCAPGCGPEDYEVGHLNHIPAFNCVNEAGLFDNFGPFNGWRAKTDDKKFIDAIEESGALIYKQQYVHEYPHGERSHQPVIFRTTKQWFFKVEDLKEKMLKANEDIYWYPQGGRNAFTSWLENLRDNSITKQRYWGTAVPIWQAGEKDYIVVGSLEELEKLSGTKVKEMHIPDIDKIKIHKDGKIYTRIPDVLDVWIDAGTASWNCLNYPTDKETFQTLFPADFILEGKDQIRGWFNLLMVASFLAFDTPAFKNVYMHGFVTDVSGVKMSKSLGNITSPYEVIDKHGADVLRYYMCQTTAGEDINFSWEECAQKQRNLNILWNLHKLLITLAAENKMNPYKMPKRVQKVLDLEEKYIISKLHSTIKKVTELMEAYRLDECIAPLEQLFLSISRTYVQMVREKSSIGDDEDKEKVLYTLGYVLLETIKLLGIIAPFLSEAMYLNLKKEFKLKEKSISHFSWPACDTQKIDAQLEMHLDAAQEIIQAALYAREKAKLGLRWPVQEVLVVSTLPAVSELIVGLRSILTTQINTKSIRVVDKIPGVTMKVKPEYGKLGPAFGNLSPSIINILLGTSPETIVGNMERNGFYGLNVGGKEVKLTKEMVTVERSVPLPFIESEFSNGMVYLNTSRTIELEGEGFSREV
ncbi:MAG: isoleucine--tRNA ligase, partial [Nanoarchaeota archaeon]|nr:isoleucine--tRNA ligase [Nanoarchaeota archaeon]